MIFLNRSKWDFKRENSREYLVISVREEEKDYTEGMVSRNRIEGLLPLSKREMNGEVFYYYDVTGKKVFSEMFNGENDMMERMDVERICTSICLMSDAVNDYLLDEDHVIIEPDSMFYDADKQIYEFLYVPGDVKTLFSVNTAGEKEDYTEYPGVLREDVKVYHGEVEDPPEVRYDFKKGVRLVWDRVMEKFDHQSCMEDLKRVYEIHQKVYSESFDPGEVFAAKKEKSHSNMLSSVSGRTIIEGEFREKETEGSKVKEDDRFSRESLKSGIQGNSMKQNRQKGEITDQNEAPGKMHSDPEEGKSELEKAKLFWGREESDEGDKSKKTVTLGEKIMAFDLKTCFGDLSKKFFAGKEEKKGLFKKKAVL